MSDASKPLLMAFPMDLASHYLRCIALCRKLEPSFRIEVADSEEYGPFARAANLKTFETASFEREKIKSSAASFDFSWINEGNLRNVMESQVNAIKEKRPYAVLGDTFFTLKMAAEKASVKYISLVNSYMTRYYGLWRGVPRSHPGFKFSKTLPPRLFEIIAREMEGRSLRAVHEPFQMLRKAEKLKLATSLLEELEGDLNLVCDLPDLFPLRGAPQNYRCIGPLFHLGIGDEPDVLRFLEGSRKNILVTMGSSGDMKKLSFLENSIFGDYSFIVAGNAEGGISPKNSLSKPFINNFSIMPKIDLVICHGGNGTIYQALSHGVPVLCLPANFECEWNSFRVQSCGLGEVIDAHWSASETRSKMETWIKRRGDHEFGRVSKEIAQYLNSPIEVLQYLK
jgi:UDP:flavonoid glycosyltransferase YjiC (YdhE family)